MAVSVTKRQHRKFGNVVTRDGQDIGYVNKVEKRAMVRGGGNTRLGYTNYSYYQPYLLDGTQVKFGKDTRKLALQDLIDAL